MMQFYTGITMKDVGKCGRAVPVPPETYREKDTATVIFYLDFATFTTSP
jgi:hypothetical protein